jgi:hypothetical protein
MCCNETTQQRQSADMRHEQLTAEPANYVMFHTGFGKNMNVRKELSDANAKLKNAATALEAEQRANQKVVHAARQYEERYSDRMRIVDKTVDYEKQRMDDFKKGEQAVIQDMSENATGKKSKLQNSMVNSGQGR